MFTTLKRALVILATFAGAMLLLLPLQALAKTPAPAQAAFPSSTEKGLIGLSLNTEPVPVTDTASLTNTIGGEAPEGMPVCPSSCTTFLPIVYGPPFLFLGGQINLVQEDNRVMGLTVFEPIVPGLGQPIEVTLDFSELQFSAEPQSVKAWVIGGSVYDGPYAEKSIPLTITETNPFPGAYKAMIVFKSGSIEIPQEFVFFYIPNGHFKESESESWNLFGNMSKDNNPEQVLPQTGNNKGLRLYVTDDYENYPNQTDLCTMAHIGFAAASIDLVLPSTGAYHLFVDGIVYTQDQNPSNNATFDAFEILLNGHVVRRYSNQDQPIRCVPVINRQVVVDARIPLSGYSGITTLGLQNHQRFDNQFATYTEINMVWIDY